MTKERLAPGVTGERLPCSLAGDLHRVG
jgi:hypothetical protein